MVVEIKNSGFGIPADLRSRMFGPFFTTKPQGEGSRLGLDIVHPIGQKQGVKIEVCSRPGHNTFQVDSLLCGGNPIILSANDSQASKYTSGDGDE